MAEIKSRITSVQGSSRPVPGIEQTPAQGALQQIEAHQCNIVSPAALLPVAGPVCLDLTDPLDHQFVVGSVWPAMKRQACAQRRAFRRGKELAVTAKVVDAEAVCAEGVDHAPQWSKVQDLPRNQVVTLLVGEVA